MNCIEEYSLNINPDRKSDNNVEFMINQDNNNLGCFKKNNPLYNSLNYKHSNILIDQFENEDKLFEPKLIYIKRGSTEFDPIKFKGSYVTKDKNNPFVHSFNDFHLNSFLAGQKKIAYNHKKGLLEVPSPTFIDYGHLNENVLPLSTENIFKGHRKDTMLGLVLTDKALAQKFNGVVTKMMKSMVSSFFSRKPISLSVSIFEPKSTLQRISESWIFSQKFLSIACIYSNNPLERFKNCISFAISGFYISARQLKPFNPILGETFEGKLSENISIYCEQISHYPTIARFLLIDNLLKYKFYGFHEFLTKNKKLGSLVTVERKGPNTIHFSDGIKIIYNIPKLRLINCTSDIDRSSYFKGYMICVDTINNLKAVIKFAGNKNKINDFEGYIQNFNFPKNYKFDVIAENKYAKSKTAKLNVLSNIKGSWLDCLYFDDKIYWNVNDEIPETVSTIKYPIPSDGRFREDLIWVYRSFYNAKDEGEKSKFLEYAQLWKTFLEQKQRIDRELRNK